MRRTVALGHLTFLHRTPAELIELAAASGFDAVSLRLSPASDDDDVADRYAAPEQLREARAAIDRTGVGVLDVEVISFAPDTEPATFAPVLEAAQGLGARYLIVTSRDPDPARFTGRLATFSELAAERGLRAMLEFIPYTSVHSLPEAATIVQATRAGLLIDALHLARAGGAPEQLAQIDPDRFGYVQVCDGPRDAPPAGLLSESRHDRKIPGTGELPLADLLEALPQSAEISVEAPSDELLVRLGEDGLARRLRDSVDGLLKEPAGRQPHRGIGGGN